MERVQFEDKIEQVYSIFGKKVPDYRILDAIWKRIEALPSGFMDYVLERFQDEDKMPSNMGKFLIRDLWPDYLASHPELRAARRFDCEECGGSGYIHAFRHDDTIYSGIMYCFDCVCKKGFDKGWTRQRIKETGNFIFTDLELSEAGSTMHSGNQSAFMRTVGHEEQVRERHLEYMENEVEF